MFFLLICIFWSFISIIIITENNINQIKIECKVKIEIRCSKYYHCLIDCQTDCSVAKSPLIFCDPMDCSMPDFPVFFCLPEFAQTHVHWVGDAIQPSQSSVTPFTSCPQSSKEIGINIELPIDHMWHQYHRLFGHWTSDWIMAWKIYFKSIL